MRWVLRLLAVVVVLAAIVAVADVVAADRVQSAAAARVESDLPGSRATVHISSFPFLVRLAAAGEVRRLRIDVTGVTDDGLALSRVDLAVDDLGVDRSALLHGRVEPVSLRTGTVTAEVTQASVDAKVGVPVTFGAGKVGVDGVDVPATLAVSGDTVTVTAADVVHFSLAIPALDVLPCVGDAALVAGAVDLSCRFTSLPPALAGLSFSF